eukprot:TRINITY_DN1556_c0_g1_i1.p1 TRINITY_DN1556_c0_g1~~TRINITY_DN1556_c0_g1_i1.p1  ORF type:complete len:193 (+),score=39.32 TRINITY_DN1556_c0_g1_i1:84-662(+)
MQTTTGAIRKHITHVIFDMDGLLLDTERVYTEATQIILDRFGKKFDWDLKMKMMGRRAIDAGNLLVDTLQIPMTAEEYLAEREVLQNQRFPFSQAMPGAIRLIQHLHKHNVPMAVATSSYKEAFELKTQNHKEWFGLFKEIVKGCDPHLKRGKPAPDIFLLAAERIGATPENCLVFEDATGGKSITNHQRPL